MTVLDLVSSAIIVIVFAIALTIRQKACPAKGWHKRIKPNKYFDSADNYIRTLISGTSIDNYQYQEIFKYFVRGVAAYRDSHHSRVIYPGVPGTRGILVEGLEGFARSGVLLAAWIYGSKPSHITFDDSYTFDIVGHLRDGLLSGTDPLSDGYWGEITDLDQRIVESADIALIVWLTRKQIWDHIDECEKQRISNWLSSVFEKKIYGGNWHLFPSLVHTILSSLGYKLDIKLVNFASKHLSEVLNEHYVGDGWYSDGKNGRVDYYNAWQMHYFLSWIAIIYFNSESKNKIVDRLQTFAGNYKYFFSTKGIPLFGRSLCYRLAAPAPLLFAVYFSEGKTIPPELARRALDTTWAHFIKQGALCHGTVSQGITGASPCILENYSGRGSCLWSLRSLCVYFAFPELISGKNVTELLPVEKSDFVTEIDSIGITVTGEAKSGLVTIFFKKNKNNPQRLISRLSFIRRFLEYLLSRPLRQSNFGAKYDNPYYDSDNAIIKSQGPD